jgi:hypothetical protein
MSHLRFPDDSDLTTLDLIPDDRFCEHCGGFLQVQHTKRRYVWSKAGATMLVIRVVHCTDPACPGYKQPVGGELEHAVALPYWSITWDVFAWIGHRRFKRHWSVPQLVAELYDRYSIEVSADWVEHYLEVYQTMVYAREADLAQWASDYAEVKDLVLTIDGLQPEKGHETLYVVREIRSKRVWFAEPLLSSSESEVRRLFERAAAMAKTLGKPVRCWMSDKQDAFVKGIEKVFPKVPHRYCANHFLRDLAKPVREQDSHAKVQMRRKVRGLRSIEKSMLLVADVARKTEQEDGCHLQGETDPCAQARNKEEPQYALQQERRQVVLEYCSCVRGILNNDQGGPLHPAGLRMSQALLEVNESIKRSVVNDESQTDAALLKLSKCIESGVGMVSEQLKQVETYTVTIAKVNEMLQPESGTSRSRRAKFTKLASKLQHSVDPTYQHMGNTMKSFCKGLFAGGDDAELPVDNMDLERAFRLPKSHERHIHGHAHAGVRIVQQGASLLLVLAGHERHPQPFGVDELLPYANSSLPNGQLESEYRRKTMTQARSSKRRPGLLNSLELRYKHAPNAT